MHRSHIDQFLLLGVTDLEFIPKTLSINTSNRTVSDEIHSNLSNIDEIKRIKGIAERIINDERKMKAREEEIQQILTIEEIKLKQRKERILLDNIMEKYKNYLKLEYKIKLLSIGNHLQQLSKNSDVRNVPDIIFHLLDEITPDMRIPSHTIIRQKINQQSGIISKAILQQFHDLFETQLQENTSIESNHRSEQTAVAYLEEFFIQAKDWVLGYAMVSMLPYAISPESKSQCIVKYQDVLDESFTPLWGRFHFHLSTSRETNSPDQILWSFSYAKSFLELLVDICQKISDTGKLHRLYSYNYYDIGIQYIIDKSVRFMRSHVAQLLETFAPALGSENVIENVATKDFIVEMMESTLEYDVTVDTFHSSSLSVSSIFYDIKTIHAYLVDIDYKYFHDRIYEAISNIHDIYISQFGSNVNGLSSNTITTTTTKKTTKVVAATTTTAKSNTDANTKMLHSMDNRVTNDGIDFTIKYSGYRCYRGIYDCLSLFHIACGRYFRMSSASQDIFATVILEPLLLLPLAILLYRIQTNKSLHRLSVSFKTSQPDDLQPEEEDMKVFGLLSEFVASANYLQSSLSSLDSKYRSIAITEGRFEERWDTVQEWIPTRYISEKQFTMKRYSLLGMLETVFTVPGYDLDGGGSGSNSSNSSTNTPTSTSANSSSIDPLSPSKPSTTNKETLSTDVANKRSRSNQNITIGQYLTNKRSTGVIQGKLGRIVDKVCKCSQDICSKLESQYQNK